MAAPDLFPSRRRWQRDLNDALREIRARYPQEPPAIKHIYFIRHAQSRSNVARAKINSGDLCGNMRLLYSGFDSPVSDWGKTQIVEMRPHAQNICGSLEAVLFSPLQRARETALGLLGDEGENDDFQAPANLFWKPLKALKEMRFKEHAQHYLTCAVSQSIMDARVQTFVQFLAVLPWQTFALVGHSRFFRTMLRQMGQVVRIENAEIWRAELRQEGLGLQCTSFVRIAQPRRSSDAIADTDTEDDKDLTRASKTSRSTPTSASDLEAETEDDCV
eukprot:TRINITY_DN10077_c0_g1_i1.p1 TRINITY_DN10077_c0_g1~~TRINITY_DN10077_c0_g1_i1.p1  ORF type:complete len:275 (-),score=30.79 TRINITY_DN10077_c0_g1_i1:245-1069(-)